MATKIIKFKGRCAYAMFYKPDEFMEKVFWKVSFYPDKGELDRMKHAGIKQAKNVKNDDGTRSGVEGDYVVLKRETTKGFKGEVKEFNPPWLRDKDGAYLVHYQDDGERVGEPILVGNGSVVEVEVEVYDAPPYGKGCRLRGMKLIDLIEYVPPEEVTENEADGDEPEEEPEVKVEEKKPEPKKRTRW